MFVEGEIRTGDRNLDVRLSKCVFDASMKIGDGDNRSWPGGTIDFAGTMVIAISFPCCVSRWFAGCPHDIAEKLTWKSSLRNSQVALGLIKTPYREMQLEKW